VPSSGVTVTEPFSVFGHIARLHSVAACINSPSPWWHRIRSTIIANIGNLSGSICCASELFRARQESRSPQESRSHRERTEMVRVGKGRNGRVVSYVVWHYPS
jgi:hypothetical protein